jgi:hypothetical protein
MDLKVNTEEKREVISEQMQYITLSRELYAEMFEYVDAFSPKECSWCGLVERIEHKFKDGDTQIEFNVSEIFFPNQKNTGGTTDIEADAVGELVTQLVTDGKDASQLRFHGHSHNTMAVFHSSTDEENYEDMKTGDFLVSFVLNTERHLFARIDYYKPFNITINAVPVYIDIPEPVLDTERIKDNIERVKKFDVYVPSTPTVVKGYKGKNYSSQPYLYDDDCYGYGNIGGGGYASPSWYKTGNADDEDRAEYWEHQEQLESMGLVQILRAEGMPYGVRSLRTGKAFEIGIDDLADYEVYEEMEKDDKALEDKEIEEQAIKETIPNG